MSARKPTRRELVHTAASAFVADQLTAQQPVPTDDPAARARIGGLEEGSATATVSVRVTREVTITQPVSDLESCRTNWDEVLYWGDRLR